MSGQPEVDAESRKRAQQASAESNEEGVADS
jgi:hypothetical protein